MQNFEGNTAVVTGDAAIARGAPMTLDLAATTNRGAGEQRDEPLTR